jgi:hypothetical protein
MSEWNQSQQDLAALIDRIFADGKVDPAEREVLRTFWSSRALTVAQVRAVVDRFVDRLWGEVISDGVVTADERRKLWAVVDGLHLPQAVLPDPVWQAITAPRG